MCPKLLCFRKTIVIGNFAHRSGATKPRFFVLPGAVLIIAILFFAFSISHVFFQYSPSSSSNGNTSLASSFVTEYGTLCYAGGVGILAHTNMTVYHPSQNVAVIYGLYGDLWNTEFNVTTNVFEPNSALYTTFTNTSISFLGPMCPQGPDGTSNKPALFSETFALPSNAATGKWKLELIVTPSYPNASQEAETSQDFTVT